MERIAMIAEHGVGDCMPFSHIGGQGDLLASARRQETLVMIVGCGVPAVVTFTGLPETTRSS